MGSLRHWFAVLIAATLASLGMQPAEATGDGSVFEGDTSPGGVNVRGYLDQAREAATAGELSGVQYEYVQVSFCARAPGDAFADFYCDAAVRECANNAPEQGLGPATRVFRRAAGEDAWEARGVTCFPDLVGGSGPELTMAMIVEAFHDTPFAVPRVQSQPEGNTTLVTLPTYYRVEFAEAGFGPDEVDSTSLLGFTVEIRPRLDSVTYHFGDGAVFGPSTDLGGVYPSGAVIHEYDQRGAFDAYAVVSYGGQFRVEGGEWADIPGTATITGDPTTITVMESRARLVTSDH